MDYKKRSLFPSRKLSFEFKPTLKEIECLELLKRRILEEDSLKNFLQFFDEPFLLSFVKGKKYNVASAFSTLVNYINVRRYKYPDLFKTMLPSNNLALGKVIRKLKHQDPQGRNVIVNRVWMWNVKEIPVDDTTKLFLFIMDENLRVGSHVSEGCVCIFDIKGFTFEHTKVANPRSALQLVDLLWKNVPVRHAGLHFVHEGVLLNMLLHAIRPFLPTKIRQRMFCHSNNLESLHKSLPREILPESLGGLLPEDEAFDEDLEDRIRGKENYYLKFAETLAK